MPLKPDDAPDGVELATAAHVKYIQSLDSKKDEYEYWLTEHLRLNGLYWGLTALHLLGRPDALPRDEVVAFVLSCQHENGGLRRRARPRRPHAVDGQRRADPGHGRCAGPAREPGQGQGSSGAV